MLRIQSVSKQISFRISLRTNSLLYFILIFGPGADPISLLILLFMFFLLGDALQKRLRLRFKSDSDLKRSIIRSV